MGGTSRETGNGRVSRQSGGKALDARGINVPARPRRESVAKEGENLGG